MKALWLSLGVFMLAIVLSAVVLFYPYIFSREVSGTMLSVEKVGPQSVMSTGRDKALAFSFAVAIKDAKTGEIFTASSEDRQWGAWEKLSGNGGTSYCVEARLYPYAPWNLSKSGTYHNARLLKVSESSAKPSAKG